MIRASVLVLAHVAVAVVVIGLLYRQYDEREGELRTIRRQAAESRSETERMQRENVVNQRLRSGLERSDPFVVELLAREKLRLTRPGEIALPPAPAAIDKPTLPGTTSPPFDAPGSGAIPKR